MQLPIQIIYFTRQTQPDAVNNTTHNTGDRTMSKALNERHSLIIQSGPAVWTRAHVWSVDGIPDLMRGGLSEAIPERELAEAYRKEGYPALTEPARIVSVTLTEN